MKKTLSAILATAVIACGTVAFADFSDVPRDDSELSKAVYDLSYYRVISGYEDGTFRPNAAISRAELARLVWMIIVYGDNRDYDYDAPTIYTDVPEDHWAAAGISYLTMYEVFYGRGDGLFCPEDAVTYEETVKVMVNTLGYGIREYDNESYPDYWLLKAEELGLIDGSKEDTTQYITRSEVVLMLGRLIDIPRKVRDDDYLNWHHPMEIGSRMTPTFRESLEEATENYNEWKEYEKTLKEQE